MPEPKRCSCCEKHTLRAEEEKKKLLNRLRRIEGQVRGLQRMISQGDYCIDILTQVSAVQSALDVISDGQLTLLATAIMALPVLPSVVITDMGLVNGANQTFVPVFADAEA